jgi:hypothetical protein
MCMCARDGGGCGGERGGEGGRGRARERGGGEESVRNGMDVPGQVKVKIFHGDDLAQQRSPFCQSRIIIVIDNIM